jgi:hypothetical protein
VGISLNTSDNSTVVYSSNPSKGTINDVWNYDNTTQTITTNGVGRYSQTRPALYNNNGTLAAMDVNMLKNQSNFSQIAQWSYVNGGNWCLTNNPTLCMNLDLPVTTNPTSVTVSSRTSPNSATQWMNLPLLRTF